MPEPDDDYILPRELVKGDKVLVVLGNDKKKHGVVEKVNGDEASVISGSIRMKLKTKALRLVSGLAAAESNAVKRSATSSLRPSVKSEIDLRGLTGEDAWFSTDKYLDDAILGGLNSVTLIHGKGTGALRKAMWDYLKRDSRVASYRMGAYGEGDSGVTVVEFKKKK
ncbi:Endonuclease MutS2 [bioreactor metagenome]|uniref:Endonuclease MutS2 n=1 Tax=bioreactor metagenome TaxID=1076179 RepID=A0A645AHJ6_9ZZZZ